MSLREWLEAEATWWDRLVCRVFGCRPLIHGGWDFRFCIRCGKRTAEAGRAGR